MTGFEFDLCPFNIDGYSVDGNLASYCSCWLGNPGSGGAALPGIGSPSSPNYLEPDRGVVWGMEYPDLLITETTAFHDKAWADTKLDTNKKALTTDPKTPDLDFDQARLPQGSLFVELYCPGKPNSQSWPTLANGGSVPTSVQGNNNSPYLPTELYDVTTPAPNYGVGTSSTNPSRTALGPGYANVGTLDLERMTPLNPSVTGGNHQYPVWRLALARATPPVTGAQTPPNPRPSQGATGTLNPNGPYMPVPGSALPALAPNPLQSVGNRFMTRPDTTTVMPYTSLSTHFNNANYSERYLAVSKMYTIPATVPAHSAQPATTTPTNAVLDSYVVTDFVDSTATNLPANVVFLQRFVYFCRPVANAPNLYPPASNLNNSSYPTLVYPPYYPTTGSVTSPASPTMTTTNVMGQTIYQFRPQTTSSSGGLSSGGTVQPRLLLHPGSYAVVGPRRSSHSPAAVKTTAYEDVTFIGYSDGTTVKTSATPAGIWYPQAIDLGTHIRPYHLLNPVMMLTPTNLKGTATGRGGANYDPVAYSGYPDNTGFMTTKIKNPLCIPCASGRPGRCRRPVNRPPKSIAV